MSRYEFLKCALSIAPRCFDPEAFYDPGATEQKPWKFDMKYIEMSHTPVRADVQAPGSQTIDLNNK